MRGKPPIAPMDVVCEACGMSFRRQHGHFPRYCSVGCRPDTNIPATLAKFSRLAESGCIEWTGSLTKSGGYGQLSVNGMPKRAHRVAYELVHGQIPNRFLVCHYCDNPKCINVDHLFLGTHADNIRDCISKGRARKFSKLAAEDIIEMRALHRAGVPIRQIAIARNLVYITVYYAVTGRHWRHVHQGLPS